MQRMAGRDDDTGRSGSPAGAEAGQDFGTIAAPGSFMTISTVVD